jgi:hypothetical protein
VVAGKWIPLKKAFSVLPAGIAMGFVIISMLFVHDLWLAASLMFFVGFLSGFFVVPLNAMLQHRGFMLMGAGHSIAVQNFNENLGILLMVGAHAMLVKFFSAPLDPTAVPAVIAEKFSSSGLPPMHMIIIGFGLFVALTMIYITRLYREGVRKGTMHD